MYIGEWVQNLIHKLEVGAGRRVLRNTVLTLLVVALAVLYDLRAFRNFSAPEAMDKAQLARNIADGKGYTTSFIRPLSLYLVQRNTEAMHEDTPVHAGADFAQIHAPHPDLANPPVYPVVLAGLMKVLPFHFDVETKKSFWSDGGRFLRYQPDFLIAVFNEILLLVVMALTFLLARKLFDPAAAWLSALLVLGCALLWRFSVSGLSTMLLMVIFLGLTWCVLKIEELAREPQPRPEWLLGLAGVAGVLAGVGALTRYAFGWVIIPVVAFLALFGIQQRVWQVVVALGAFAIVLTPWMIRNWMVSGTPFGTAGYAIAEGATFPGTVLERSAHPDLTYVFLLKPIIHKFLGNLRGILENDLPKLGGSWAEHVFPDGFAVGISQHGGATRALFFADVPGNVHRLSGPGGDGAFHRIAGGEFREPDRADGAVGVHLRRGFLPDPFEADKTAGDATALRCHRALCAGVVFADDLHLVHAEGLASGLSAILPAGHPENRRVDEGK